MPVQSSQGKPRPQVPRANELPAGVPEQARPAPERDDAGRFVPSDGTSAMAKKGGEARRVSVQLARLLGLKDVDDAHPWAPYAKLAREFRDNHMEELAATVGGGVVGSGPASVISTAALQLAASRYFSDLGAELGDAKMLLDAARLGDQSRGNLLSAAELCAREAAARPARREALPWLNGGSR